LSCNTQVGDLVGHLRQEGVTARHAIAQEDLDVDLVVGGVDAGRVVDEVGVDAPPARANSIRPALGQAEVAALADHLGPQVRAVDRIASLALSPTSACDSRWP
jgi:hypothetical protein